MRTRAVLFLAVAVLAACGLPAPKNAEGHCLRDAAKAYDATRDLGLLRRELRACQTAEEGPK